MALRLIEMACPEGKRHEVDELVRQFEPLGLWHDQLMDSQVLMLILLPAEKAEAVLDRLESVYGRSEGFRIMMLGVQASVPRAEAPAEAEGTAPAEPAKPVPERVSRQELDADMSASAQISRVFIAMTILSAVVATIGMWRGNVAAIIGAMVIAPLLGPNMALAFATTLGDGALGRRAIRTLVAGGVVALAVSALMGGGLALTHGGVIDVVPQELLSRTDVRLTDIALALAAGTAGALAFTSGVHTALVGVMVAVALLPPLVATGIFVGLQQWAASASAALLFLTNLICVNVAAVGTFLAFGIHPRTWWETDRARRAARQALVVWIALLVLLAGIILVAQRS